MANLILRPKSAGKNASSARRRNKSIRRNMSIPEKITKMPARLSLLLLQAGNLSGTLYPPDEALCPVEEQMTGREIEQATAFLNWCHEHKLTFGHGTIDLRWTEFKKKLMPVSQDEAYHYAITPEELLGK